jgi:glycosyltransferase involved in cell wall biosynthesis
MKILHITTAFPPAYAYGGPVNSSYKLCKEMAKNGYDVTVFTTDGCDAENRVDIDNPEDVDGIPVWRFRNVSNYAAWHWRISTPVGMIPVLRRRIPEFDVVHLHEFRTVGNAAAFTIAKRNDIPVVLQPRGSVPRMKKSTLKSIFDSAIGERMIEDSDALIASSNIESSQFKNYFENTANKIYHTPNGIDTEDYLKLPEENGFREKFNLEEEFIILYLGRIAGRKGIDILVKSFRRFLSKYPNSQLVIAGPDDGYLSKAKRLVKEQGLDDSVTFPGGLYGDDKLQSYLDSDVFVLPSKNQYESFGNVVLEAMACKTPVVVTDVCGVSEWVNTRGCEVVPPNSEGIFDYLNTIRNQRPYDGQRLRNYAFDNFKWEEIADDTVNLYNELI